MKAICQPTGCQGRSSERIQPQPTCFCSSRAPSLPECRRLYHGPTGTLQALGRIHRGWASSLPQDIWEVFCPVQQSG